MSILVLGSINTDLVIRTPRLPAPGETVLGGEFYRAGGGKGANQAVAAARAARSPVTLLGAVGDDPFGREMLERFAAENLRCEHVRVIPGVASGVAIILVDAHGQNLISVASGANAAYRPEDLDRVPDALFQSARVFVTGLEMPLAAVARGLVRAKRLGLTTILNPAPASPEVVEAGLLAKVDVLTPNEIELEQLATYAGCRGKEQTEQVRALQAAGCRNAIVTRGPQGCLVAENGTTTEIPGRQVLSVDATAAGDAFTGALAVALAEGRSLVESARWANVAASISVTRQGAQPSLPTRDDIDDVAEGWP